MFFFCPETNSLEGGSIGLTVTDSVFKKWDNLCKILLGQMIFIPKSYLITELIFILFLSTIKKNMAGLNGKPTDLQNILQGDDSHRGLNSSLNNTIPTDFDDPSSKYNGMGSNKLMDSHNNGDHDLSGRFDPYGGLPSSSGQHVDDPGFTRQLAPIIGSKHADDDEGILNQDSNNERTFPNTETRAYTEAPILGEKRTDEPDEDRIGIDPSRGKLKMD